MTGDCTGVTALERKREGNEGSRGSRRCAVEMRQRGHQRVGGTTHGGRWHRRRRPKRAQGEGWKGEKVLRRRLGRETEGVGEEEGGSNGEDGGVRGRDDAEAVTREGDQGGGRRKRE